MNYMKFIFKFTCEISTQWDYLETRCEGKLGIKPLRISINQIFTFKYNILLKYYWVYNSTTPQTTV